MPFRFRLERVLEWERKNLDREKRLTAECHRLVTEVRDAIARLHAEHLMIEREWLEKKTIPGSDAASLGRYRLGVRKAERTLLTEQEHRDRNLHQQTAKMLQVQQKLRVLENLRGRKLGEYTYLVDREMEQVAAESYLAVWNSRNAQAPSPAPGSRPERAAAHWLSREPEQGSLPDRRTPLSTAFASVTSRNGTEQRREYFSVEGMSSPNRPMSCIKAAV